MKLSALEQSRVEEAYEALQPHAGHHASVLQWLTVADPTATYGELLHQLQLVGYQPSGLFTLDMAIRFAQSTKARTVALPDEHTAAELATFAALGGGTDGEGTVSVRAVRAAMDRFQIRSDLVENLAARASPPRTLGDKRRSTLRSSTYEMHLSTSSAAAAATSTTGDDVITFEMFSQWCQEQFTGGLQHSASRSVIGGMRSRSSSAW